MLRAIRIHSQCTGIFFLGAVGLTAGVEMDQQFDPPGLYAPVPGDGWREPPDEKSKRLETGSAEIRRGGTVIAPSMRQPSGALSNVVVYLSGGHGWTALSGAWTTQRPLLFGMVEDFGNLDQINLFAQYCFNAGATVVPFRPLGYQTNEVVLDNDDAGVSFSGAWNNSSATIFYGSPGDTPYRFASISTNGETASARYVPDISDEGYYPVYCWTRRGPDRVKQLYRVQHSGGISSLRINHERTGSGWIWLGTYHFHGGTNGWVEISNDAPGYNPANDVIIADAIRFGNGMGDIDRGFGLSGFPREQEASRYWVQNMTGQGMSTSLYDLAGFDDQSDNVGAPARMADYMDDETSGTYWDRIYIAFHSNAGSGTGRGAMGLYHTGNSAGKQVQQQSFSDALNRELETDMEFADSGEAFQDDWVDNSTDILGGTYGEISDSSNPNMNSTILEVGFHDNEDDANLLKDPAARLVIARASFQGMVKHLATNNASVLSALLPDPPTHLTAQNMGSGLARITWKPAQVDGAGGDAATAFTVYASTNGQGFAWQSDVNAAAATSTVITGLVNNATWYFRVSARNSGGESLPSETVGLRCDTGSAPVLVVNGYDRFQRSICPVTYFSNNLDGFVTLVRPLQVNSFDYVVEHGDAVGGAGYTFDSAANEAVEVGLVPLSGRKAVVWIGGLESTFDEAFSTSEQARVISFLSESGALFVSGAEIGWDLFNLGSGADRAFYSNYLMAAYVSDDAGTYSAVGDTGSVFSGMGAFSFDYASIGGYDVAYPDTLSPRNGSVTAMRYGSSPGAGAVAAIQFSNAWKIVHLGFPFEAITTRSARTNLMKRALEFFAMEIPAAPVTSNALVISEIMQNPTAVADTAGEWFEVYNPGVAAVDINGWRIRDDGTDSHIITNGVPLLVPAGGFLVLGRNSVFTNNGGVNVQYAYASITLGNADDEIVLLNGTTEMARVVYDGGTLWPNPAGASMYLTDLASDMNLGANWAVSTTAWPGSSGDAGSPGERPALPPYEPVILTGASNGTVHVIFDSGDLPIRVYWTDSIYLWPTSQASPISGAQWSDTNPPALMHRFFRFTK